MKCPRCQAQNREGVRFCEDCGARLALTCPDCGAEVSPDKKFCGSCGTPLAPFPAARFVSPQVYTPKHLAEKILTSRSALEGERKQVTVLFCDLANSTALAERLGPEPMHSLLNRFFELALAEVHRYEGTINQFLGDGFMALFGAPLAHEDHARRAVLAALGIQRALRERQAEFAPPEGVGLAVRMGLNTGPVVVGKIGDNLRMDYTAVGDTTHLAARLQQMTEPGAILVSEAIHRLLEGLVESIFLGERDVKGLPPQRVWRIDGLKPHAARFDAALHRGLTPLVGRSRELETLERAYHETRAGTLRVLNVAGEAGIGKSRVLYEFRQRLQGERAFFLQGSCSAYGTSTSFLPFIEVVRAAFRLRDGDSPAAVEGKLRRGLEILGLKAEEALPLLQNLLGLDPGPEAFRGLDGEIIGARTRDLLQRILRERCRLSPVVLVVDDLHWTDRASEELLLRAIRSGEHMPLLILCAYRPQYRPPWAGSAGVTDLSLDPLPDDMTVSLVQRRLGSEALSPELVRIIAEKAEGNPLFAEELARYLEETGSLTQTERGVSGGVATASVPVPGTLQDIIMARVDRLPEGPLTLLQVASVIGRRFPAELVQMVSGVNGHLPEYLRELEVQELIFRRDADGRTEYVFKHALIQDAIYDSLLTSRREPLHERVAEAIEQSYPNRLGEWAEVLAHHWGRTSRTEKIVRYLTLAGQKSLRVYSLDEANERFSRVVEQIEAHPGCADEAFLADVLLSWARVYYYQKDVRGLVGLERYLPRVEASGNQRCGSLLQFWVAFGHFFAARYDLARELARKALALGEALEDEECIGYASMGLMYANLAGPGLDDVPRLGQRALEIATRLGDVYLASKCTMCLSFYELTLGRLDEARRLAVRLLEVGREASDPRTVAMGLYTLAYADFYDERYQDAIERAEESLRVSPDPLDRMMARNAKAMALAMGGGPETGLEMLREIRSDAHASDYIGMLLWSDAPYGVALVMTGQLAAGVHWIEAAIERARERNNHVWAQTGHLMLGEIYLQMVLRGRQAPPRLTLRNLTFLLKTVPVAARKARHHLEEALRGARDMGLPGWTARSLMNLGLLSRAKRRPDEARRHLQEALSLAEPHSSVLAGKIRAALESLGPAPAASPS